MSCARSVSGNSEDFLLISFIFVIQDLENFNNISLFSPVLQRGVPLALE